MLKATSFSISIHPSSEVFFLISRMIDSKQLSNTKVSRWIPFEKDNRDEEHEFGLNCKSTSYFRRMLPARWNNALSNRALFFVSGLSTDLKPTPIHREISKSYLSLRVPCGRLYTVTYCIHRLLFEKFGFTLKRNPPWGFSKFVEWYLKQSNLRRRRFSIRKGHFFNGHELLLRRVRFLSNRYVISITSNDTTLARFEIQYCVMNEWKERFVLHT